MIFSSLVFVCVFFPIVFVLYNIIPSIKWKNALLIMVSLLFYAYGEPIYVLLMLASALFNYVLARIIAKCDKGKKFILFAGIFMNLGILAVFKYTDFIVQTWNQVFDKEIPLPGIELPIGISFFTFQALSYVIDVYRGSVEVQKRFCSILLYISFFPQLIAGPIVKYRDISCALEERKQDAEQVSQGMRRFICGLGKKIMIANTMGLVADDIFALSLTDVNIALAWLGAITYTLQIYYDFSGYSDMAIGIGKMFGFQFGENFQYPYGADSVKEFWRRWHISLSTWFREYLYIPLGGNRHGRVRTCVNKVIVFFFTGLWHGANWTFVVWGLWHGMFLVIEEYARFLKKMPKVLKYVYTMLVVCVGFVIFRGDTLSQGMYFIQQMFTGFDGSENSMRLFYQYLTPWFIVMWIVAVLGAAPIRPVADKIRVWISDDRAEDTNVKRVQKLLYFASVILLVWCILRLSGNSYNPFIYFRF